MIAHQQEWKYGDRVTFTVEWQHKNLELVGTITSFCERHGIISAHIWVSMSNISGVWTKPLYTLAKVIEK